MKHSDPTESVRAFLDSIGIPAPDTKQVLTSLAAFVDLILEHAAHKSLLSASQRNPESIWSHIFDSLQPLALPSARECLTLVDAGSGGGLPGIPLALARPDAKVLLVERGATKAEFLEFAKALLPLPNVDVSSSELRIIANGIDRNSVILSRALVQPENWPTLVKKTKLRICWIVFATQTNRAAWESAASKCEMKAKASHEYSLPDSDLLRSLLEFGPP